jgi:hypothetical protein
MAQQDDMPKRPFPVATNYRDGTPVGEAPDHRTVSRAINHGGTIGERIARELISDGMKEARRDRH